MARLTNDLGAVRMAAGPAIMYLVNTIAGGLFAHDQAYLNLVARELNNRPRRILGYRTPAEVFTDLLASSIASTG